MSTSPLDNSSKTIRVSAPGRVNLIGEHTDYTGGLVLPMAIPFETTVALTPANSAEYVFASAQFGVERVMESSDRSEAAGDWSDYPVGVLREFQKLDMEVPPFRAEITGTVPLGAGLSSSASLEVATAVALLQLAGRTLPVREIALLCQRAENLYVGSPCGIMDQFVVAAARGGHALLLNTRDYTTELLPMNTGALSDCVVVVVNSMVKHTVTAGSDYAQRRKELEDGQEVLRDSFGVQDLGDARLEQLESLKDSMSAESFRRCRHVLTENQRVRDAAAAMVAGDADALGRLLTAAHASERDDFECSIAEVDYLVATAIVQPGCFGSRLTGGGFGGCTVNLVQASAASSFLETVQRAYRGRFGIAAEGYIFEPVDGAVVRVTASMETATVHV